MTKHVTEDPVPPRERNPQLSGPMNDLIIRMMQKERADRYQSPARLLQDVERLMAGGDVPSAIPQVSRPTTRRFVRKGAAQEGRAAPRHVPASTVRAPARSRSVPLVVFAVVAVLVAAVLFFVFSGKILKRPPERDRRTTDRTGDDGPPVEDETVVAEHEAALKRYGEIHDGGWDEERNDFLTRPWGVIQKNLERFHDSEFQPAWTEIWMAFEKEANEHLVETVWEPLDRKAQDLLTDHRYEEALACIDGIDPKYLYFDVERENPTQIVEEKEAFRKRALDKFDKRVHWAMEQAGRAAEEGRYEDAYSLSDEMEKRYGKRMAAQYVRLVRRRTVEREFDSMLEPPVTSAKLLAAQGRLNEIRERYPSEAELLAYCDGRLKKLTVERKKAVGDAEARAEEIFGGTFLMEFGRALKARDVRKARALFHDLLFGEGKSLVQDRFRCAKTDWEPVRLYLEPGRTPDYDWAKLISMMEDAYGFEGETLKGGVALELRTLILVESALAMAGRGAEHASHDQNRFRVAYPEPLSLALSARPLERKAGEPYALELTGSKVKEKSLPLEPGPGPLSAAHIVKLMERSYSENAPTHVKMAEQDPYFHLRAGLIYHYAGTGEWPKAMKAFDRVSGHRPRMGISKYLSRYASIATEEEEEGGEKLYRKMVDDLKRADKAPTNAKRLDALGEALRKCIQLRDKYAKTAFMKQAAPDVDKSLNRRVVEFIEGIEAELERSEKPSRKRGQKKPAPKAGELAALFSGEFEQDGSKHVLTYSFDAEKELEDWRTVVSGLQVERGKSRVHLEGDGTYCFKAPFEGDVEVEVALTPRSEKNIGFTLHGEGNRREGGGYLGVIGFERGGDRWRDWGRGGRDWKYPILRLPLTERGRDWENIGKAKTDYDIVADRKGTFVFRKRGRAVDLIADGKTVTATSQASQKGSGLVGITLLGSKATVHSVKITGRISPAWIAEQFGD
jgi:hypothetical protein